MEEYNFYKLILIILICFLFKYNIICLNNMKGPVKNIPKELINLYTLNGKIPIYNDYLEEDNDNKIIWDDILIKDIENSYTKKKIYDNTHKYFKRWKHGGEPYPDHRIGGACLLIQQAFDKYKIEGKNVAIIGSTTPWIECICLNNKSYKITTVEYNMPKCNDNRFNMMNYYDHFQNNDNKFDCIISYSSIEHSGLGRYGDILDPEGDFKTMNDIYNNLTDDGLLFLGVPIGQDALVWNAHRIYGKERFQLLIEKFVEIEWFGTTFNESQKLPKGKDWRSNYQPIVVFKKKILK